MAADAQRDCNAKPTGLGVLEPTSPSIFVLIRRDPSSNYLAKVDCLEGDSETIRRTGDCRKERVNVTQRGNLFNLTRDRVRYRSAVESVPQWRQTLPPPHREDSPS